MSEQPTSPRVPDVTLGWRIQMALANAGLRQTDLMDRFEVSRGTVSRWCRDVAPPPKKFVLNEIAVMCGVPARWLIDGEVPATPPNDGLPRLDSNQQPFAYPAPLRLPARTSTAAA